MFILLGRIVYAIIWGFLLFNLVFPYPSPARLVANVALAALVVTHGLQAWLLNASLTQQEKEKDRFIVWRIFFFGVFEALSWKKTKNKQ
ncbi:DUF1145 domain-containing protein [Zophobihabitans entericus]|uniref:DUF1145 domain-containing protein n=1 Tax=Zophobihabitans entericus TaxID=1635327 RepID=A0A6G9IB76_9GAMM|nr:DUF1145 domain-containing protein [Zophobihabitans entericus]QIQ21481.1 DUF1145 domain-containing protein [Zophobihabitans entericus]